MSEGPVLDQFNLVVSDMEASVAFYRKLGLTIPDPHPDWPDYHRTVSMPGGINFDLDTVEFAKQWNTGWRAKPGGATGVLGFRLPSSEAVDATYNDLVGAGYGAQQPPYDAFWGARYAIVEDPDGNAVGLMGPVDPARRRPPPDSV